MKKEIVITFTLSNAHETATESVLKEANEMFETLEYLSPKMDVAIYYKHDNK